MTPVVLLFLAALTMRLVSLSKSSANERKLIRADAVEYGKTNSRLLVLVHTLYYVSCIIEALLLEKTLNRVTMIGAGLFSLAMVMLWIVIVSLKDIWTVKLYIVPCRPINKSFLFKYVRHPNYFLSIIPELVGVATICQAWYTLAIGLPLYCIPLAIRIVQEERAMKAHFTEY